MFSASQTPEIPENLENILHPTHVHPCVVDGYKFGVDSMIVIILH